jgi:hypothetical protein
MNEIKETLAILKNRWHEVSLLIGLWLLFHLAALTLRICPDFIKLYQVISIGLSLFTLIVSTGFLRSVYLNQNQRQSLPALIQTGKHFFWRFLALSILCGAVMMLYFGLLRPTGIAGIISHHISGPFIKLLLAKLTLLLPAIIIVTDCSILKSFSIMWKIKLFQAKAKPLVIFFLITKIVLPTLIMLLFLNVFRDHSSINWGVVIRIFYRVLSSVMGLMLSVMAIRFVAPKAPSASLEITESLTAAPRAVPDCAD